MVRTTFLSLLYGFLACGPFPTVLSGQTREATSLDGTWQMRVEGEARWRDVQVPGTLEQQVAIDFDGQATFRKVIAARDLSDQRRLLLHCDAVATKASVWFNDQPVGEHLGGWTPFRFDVTAAARTKPAGPWEVKIQVEERVGHNTQGFLPVIGPHFGGIWQSVRLIEVPVHAIEETRTRLSGDFKTRRLEVAASYRAAEPQRLRIRVRPRGTTTWHEIRPASSSVVPLSGESRPRQPARLQNHSRFELPPGNTPFELQAWTPDHPLLYEARLDLETENAVDSVIRPFAFRTIETDGKRLLLNGQPLVVRGLLNWGYAPPRTAPQLSEAFMRSEILFAKKRGFNLMKFCLWIPPKRYLELCDELGMLAWIEYPTWHPDFSAGRLAELKTEYDEFFFHDRNHPSVILRSLTCETGPSADIAVIQSLYDQCKKRIPGSIVVDDSSWIEWNRVFDFYDDHPYGNNHTWVAELADLKAFIAARETKPLLLGEAITADTWTDPARFDRATLSPAYCRPTFLDSARQWVRDAGERYGSAAIARLEDDSRRYAMLMRKFQIETFRREVPDGGYVVSVIRDIPKAAMGLLNFHGQPKWTADDWAWHDEKMLLLQTAHDRRSFFADETFEARVIGESFEPSGKPFAERCQFQLLDAAGSPIGPANTSGPQPAARGDERPSLELVAELPDSTAPASLTCQATASVPGRDRPVTSQWTFWTVPQPPTRQKILLHESAEPLLRQIARSRDAFETVAFSPGSGAPGVSLVLLTRVVDPEVLDFAEAGGSIVLLPDNQANSFPLESHWFLRGGPIVSEDCETMFPRQMLVELQHFDLAADVIRDIHYLDSIDPLFMLWESHDLDHVKTNGLLFHMPLGSRGHLFVSALKHEGPTNAAGSYLLQKLLHDISPTDSATRLEDPVRGPANLARLRDEISQRKISLADREWNFRPDPREAGRAESWFAVDHDDADWSKIRADRHWDSQGYADLDQWAWYRLDVDIPEDWGGEPLFLTFTGVDDYYDVYVNGVQAGSGGDLQRRQTAFELRTSHDITSHIRVGQSNQITVAVHDWYGAGGIFRPVWISNQSISRQPRILK